MSVHRIAVLFPGQGVFDSSCFRSYQTSCPEFASMLADVDEVARPFWRVPVIKALSRDHPGAGLDLLVFVASVAAYRRLQCEGAQPDAIIGHGFGEIAALVAADALSFSDGAEIVVRRFIALAAKKPRSRMATIHASPVAVKLFLRILKDSKVSVAVENSSMESVIAGPAASIASAQELARMLGFPFRHLKATAGPHQASMSEVKQELLGSLSHVSRRTPGTRTFSPLLGRFYTANDDPVECFVEQLAQPLRFGDAVRQLVADGTTLFVECGPLRGLAPQLDCATVADLAYCSRRLEVA